MNSSSLTILRAAVPALALALGLAVGTLVAASASAGDAGTSYAPHVGRGYVRHADEVTAFGLAERTPVVVTAPKTGRGYVRRAGEATAFGLSGDRPVVVAAPKVTRGGALPSTSTIGLSAGR